MRGYLIAASARDALERRLEPGVLEGLDLAAVVAHEMVVMVPGRLGALEAGDAVAEVDALHEACVDEPFDRAIDAREPDAGVFGAQTVVDLLHREAAALASDEVHDDAASAAAPSARGTELLERVCRPRLHGR